MRKKIIIILMKLRLFSKEDQVDIITALVHGNEHEIALTDLDFKNRDVILKNIKTTKNIFNVKQKATRIFNQNQIATKNIFNSNQQSYMISNKSQEGNSILNEDQKSKTKICNEFQIATEQITNIFQESKIIYNHEQDSKKTFT